MMENSHGKLLSSIEEPDQIAQLAKIMSNFLSIHGQIPGPFETGAAHGLLWEEAGEPSFKSTEHMERWLNHRLLPGCPTMSFQNFSLVMCHLDVAPRNLLYLADSSVCIIDWATAGFYPRFFEVCMLHINNNSRDGKFEELLLEAMDPLTSEEEEQMWLLMRSFQNSLRYRFVSHISNLS